MIYVVMEVAILFLIPAMVILMFQVNRRKPNKKVVIITAIVLVLSFAVTGVSQACLYRILVNSAVIERDGELVRVSPYYSEEFLKSACGEEYYISPNGVDSMYTQLISKIIRTTPYID